MTLRIALAQCCHPEDGDVISSVAKWVCKASEEGADLLVFPEALMTKFDGSVERFCARAEDVEGPFARAVNELAADAGMWLVYTMNEANRGGGLPFNTAVIADPSGEVRGIYRKVHLFDAQGYRESERMAPGDSLMKPVETPFATIGLGICYDLRFPEVALSAALQGAELMLYPAAWVDGAGKVDQWETLLRARAIENGMFVAGACCVDEGRIGRSCVVAPDGAVIAEGGSHEQLVVCDIDVAEAGRIREMTPSLRHRQPAAYHLIE